jgi:hypothetical protein
MMAWPSCRIDCWDERTIYNRTSILNLNHKYTIRARDKHSINEKYISYLLFPSTDWRANKENASLRSRKSTWSLRDCTCEILRRLPLLALHFRVQGRFLDRVAVLIAIVIVYNRAVKARLQQKRPRAIPEEQATLRGQELASGKLRAACGIISCSYNARISGNRSSQRHRQCQKTRRIETRTRKHVSPPTCRAAERSVVPRVIV